MKARLVATEPADTPIREITLKLAPQPRRDADLAIRQFTAWLNAGPFAGFVLEEGNE